MRLLVSICLDQLNGRRDFDNTIREVIVRATTTRDDYTAVIPITLDLINEADEGFMVVMRANEDRSNAEDIQNLNYTRGVTLAVIRDDDREFYMYATCAITDIIKPRGTNLQKSIFQGV